MTDYKNFFPSKEYTNPSASNYNTHNSVNTETALNNAMDGKFTPSNKEHYVIDGVCCAQYRKDKCICNN